MYTGTPKADAIPRNKNGFFDESFTGGPNQKFNKNIDNEFIGISSFSDKDKLFKKSKAAFDEHESELFGQGRAPLHSNSSPGQGKGQRGNSPATGAIAGLPPPSKDPDSHLNQDMKDSIKSTNHNSSTNVMHCDDSFQKLYSKELDLDEDEVPLILHELNDSAIHFISKDQYDRALSLLQKAQTLLDRLMFQRNTCDRYLIQCTMHNMALCFQKMGALEECSLCLDACLTQVQSPIMKSVYKQNPAQKLKKLKYECKIHMQVCALLSQLNRHQEALCHAKQSVQISQYMLQDLMELCEMFNKKVVVAKNREQQAQEIISKGERAAQQFSNMFLEGSHINIKEIESKLNKSDLIYFDEQVSMLERTAHKFYPIIQEVVKRMVKHKELPKDKSRESTQYQSKWIMDKTKELKSTENDKTLANSINMRVLLGYLNQSEWMYLLNIGNIMQITPLTIHDLHSHSSIEIELARDAIIEKISFLAVSYFCVSTELRFLVNLKDNPNVDPVQIKSESEYWHGKALEISCTFLPSESPLVSHIFSSYKKHHAPVNQVIAEDKQIHEDQLTLKIIRPLSGIDQAKQCPMVRANKHMHIALSPLHLSPNNYLAKNKLKLPGAKSKEREPELGIQIEDQKKAKQQSPKPKAEIIPQPESKKQQDTGEMNIDFNKMTTLNFKTLNEENDQIDSTLKKDINLLEEDFKKMGLIDSQNKFIMKEAPESKQNVDGKNQPASNKAIVESRLLEHQNEHEQVKQFMKLEQIGDLSSILKDKIGEDETTMQSIEVADHPDRVFDPRSAPSGNQSMFQKSQGKDNGKGLRQERSREEMVTIPNNEQNEKRKPKDLQQMYLKDTTIDNVLLQKQSSADQIISAKNIKYKSRPKTSENGKRTGEDRIGGQDGTRSRQQKDNERENAHAMKYKTSTSNNHDTLDETTNTKYQTKTIEHSRASVKSKQDGSNANHMTSDQLLYNHNSQGSNKQSRPFTQQNFYAEKNGQMVKQNSTHNIQNQNSIEGNNIGNVSSSITSGVTSTSGAPAKKASAHQNFNSHKQLKIDKTGQQVQYASNGNSKVPSLAQSTERLTRIQQQELLAPPTQRQEGQQVLTSKLERQIQSQREQQLMQGNMAHITPKNKNNYVQFASTNQISAQQQSRYKQNNQIVNSANSSRQVQTAMGSSRNDITYNTSAIDQRKGSAAAAMAQPQKLKLIANKHNHAHNNQKAERMEEEAFQNSLSPNKKSGKSQKSNKSNGNNRTGGQMYASGQNYLSSQKQSRQGSKERDRNNKNMQQQVQEAKMLIQQSRSKEKITSSGVEKQMKSGRSNMQTPTQANRPSNQAIAMHISQMLQAQQAGRSASNGSEPRPLPQQNYQSQQSSATKKVKQSQLAMKQQQYLLQQQTQMQKNMQKNSSQQNVVRNPSNPRQQQQTSSGTNRGGSAKNTSTKAGQITQTNSGQIARYASNQNQKALANQNQSMEELMTNNSLMNQQVPQQQLSFQKSRNTTAGLPQSKTQGNNGMVLMSQRSSVQNNPTFDNDISQMRNIQMQIQSKLNHIQKSTSNPHKMKKTTKSAEKQGGYIQYKTNQQVQNSSRNKLQLNMLGVGQQNQTNSNQGTGLVFVNQGNNNGNIRSGPLQTVRNNEKRINFQGPNVNSNHKLIIDPQLNLMAVQKLNTYNTNSLDSSQDSNQLQLMANQFAAQSAQFPSTPNIQSQIQSARGSVKGSSQMLMINSSRSNQSQRDQQPHVGGTHKVVKIKHTNSNQRQNENSYELLQQKRSHQNEREQY